METSIEGLTIAHFRDCGFGNEPQEHKVHDPIPVQAFWGGCGCVCGIRGMMGEAEQAFTSLSQWGSDWMVLCIGFDGKYNGIGFSLSQAL